MSAPLPGPALVRKKVIVGSDALSEASSPAGAQDPNRTIVAATKKSFVLLMGVFPHL